MKLLINEFFLNFFIFLKYAPINRLFRPIRAYQNPIMNNVQVPYYVDH